MRVLILVLLFSVSLFALDDWFDYKYDVDEEVLVMVKVCKNCNKPIRARIGLRMVTYDRYKGFQQGTYCVLPMRCECDRFRGFSPYCVWWMDEHELKKDKGKIWKPSK